MKPSEYYRGRLQTYLKHFFLERYLERVACNIGSFADRFVYVDGFSGPWRSDEESFDDTSFMIAISTLRQVRQRLHAVGRTPTIGCVFVEKDATSFAQLQQAIADVEDIRITPLHAPFEDAIPAIRREISGAFSLVFIDPTGWTGFGLESIAPLFQHQGEILINFMFDHINRFLDTKGPRASFDKLFGGPGWESVVAQDDDRERSIVELYRQRLREKGGFKYATWTRIRKPTADRSYFYLVYATRHVKGLVEFRNVEKEEIEEQERVRLGARQDERITRTRQPELFQLDESSAAVRAFEQDRQRMLKAAEQRLDGTLTGTDRVGYDQVEGAMLELPLVWESDVKKLIDARRRSGTIEVLGLADRERVPKRGKGHALRKTRTLWTF